MLDKEILIRIIERFGYEDRLEVLTYLKAQPNVRLHEGNEGTHANLDRLDAKTYARLVALVEAVQKKEIDPKFRI
jgi:hypothetical protein